MEDRNVESLFLVLGSLSVPSSCWWSKKSMDAVGWRKRSFGGSLRLVEEAFFLFFLSVPGPVALAHLSGHCLLCGWGSWGIHSTAVSSSPLLWSWMMSKLETEKT